MSFISFVAVCYEIEECYWLRDTNCGKVKAFGMKEMLVEPRGKQGL